jgi:hypothetical protein
MISSNTDRQIVPSLENRRFGHLEKEISNNEIAWYGTQQQFESTLIDEWIIGSKQYVEGANMERLGRIHKQGMEP